jgi:uncharacterized membrane protein (UPF0127 family)
MTPQRFFPRLLTLLALGLLAACDPSPAPPVGPGSLWPQRLGSVDFEAVVLVQPSEMAVGLMHRTSMPENEGALFVYDTPGRKSFWMKNTHLPLDIGFFTTDGVLREIHELHPNDLTPVPSRRDDILIALEMNRGWFARHELVPGTALDLTLLRQALQKRNASIPLLE